MTPRLLLLKIITLLHLETLIEGENAKSTDLTTSLLATIKIPEADVGLIDSEREIIGALYNICRKIANAPIGEAPDKSDLLQEVRLHCSTEIDLYESFKEGIILELSQEGIKKRCSSIRKDLKEYLNFEATKKRLFDAAHTLRFKENTVEDMEKYIRELSTDLESSISKSSKKDAAILGEINMDDKASAVKAATAVTNEQSGIGKLKYHLQDLNDMLNGGQRRGEFVLASALPHNNKTGFSLDVFAGIAVYNVPFLFDEKKKPMLLRISFEDDVEMNFNHLYKHFWEQEHKEVAVMVGKTADEIAQYVMDKMTVNGWHVRMIKVDPSLWTIFDLFAYVRDLESEGFEIAMCMLDYMRKMPTTGCVQGVAGADIRDMARRCRNFFNARKTAFYTPHQISTQAKEIQRSVPKDFVKMLPGGGYYDGCKSLDAEADIELFQHIEKHNGHSYLTLHRGKHRGAPVLADDQKYLVYQFYDIGGIPPDVGDERTGLRKVGGKRAADADVDFEWM
jgi:hypothetical protein